MPRLPRPDYKNTYHHIIVRGVDGLPIFDTDKKKEKYVKILSEAVQSHDLSVYAIGFLNNHVHMFIRRNNHSMGVFYRRVNGSFGSWYNQKYSRTGALYDGRYYSSLVDSEKYFHAVWRYVHYQGVKAGFYQSVEDDPWSSAGVYLGLESNFTWIDWREALSLLEIDSVEEIRMILQQEGEEEKWYGQEEFPHEIYRGQKFLAGKAFVEQYMQIRENPVREEAREQTPVPWEKLLEEATIISGLSAEKLLEPGKSRKKSRHRSGLAYVAQKYGHMYLSEIADKLGITTSGVSRMIKRLKNEETELKKQWDEALNS